MKAILTELEKLVTDELERANKANPLFASDHEGYAALMAAAELVQVAAMCRKFIESQKAGRKSE